MTLFGALSSGVSGLTAQSSAIGAISDNITNVSTVGYKNTQVDFQTLVTKQTSSTFFSAGGVQSRPRQDTGVQGLLAASASQTDIALSGNGFFIVNEANQPTINNEFLFTRSGSFFLDNEGFLRNTGGFYLQAWPTDASGSVVPANKDLTVPNKNVISTDFLTTVNLNRVGGTAASTETIAIGANLPSNDDAGTTHKTDVQFFDTLGNPSNVSFVYSKGVRDNEWDIELTPPQGVSVTTLFADTAGATVYESRGQLEFTSFPASGASVVVDSITYQFSTFKSVTASATNPFAISGTTLTAAASGTFTGLKIGDTITISGAEVGANNVQRTITAIGAGGGSITLSGAALDATGSPDTQMTVTINDTTATKIIDVSTSTTLAQYVSAFVTKVKEADSDFTNNGTFVKNRIQIPATSSTTVFFTDDGTGSISVDPSGLLTSTGTRAVRQEVSFTVQKTASAHRDTFQFTFATSSDFTDGETVTINGIVYEFDTGGGVSGTNKTVLIPTAGTGTAGTISAADLNTVLSNLESAIEANDPEFSATSVRIRRANDTGETSPSTDANTLVLDILSKGSYNVLFSANFANTPTEPDGTASYTNAINFAVNKQQALKFSSDGLPSAFNVAELQIDGFANGAADMDDDPNNAPRISLDFGTVTEANGLTQFGGSFTPVFITQDGSQFGTFAGVTINESGLMTALFDNGETRPVFQIPIATFVNVNSLGARTGNIWNSTEGSGDPTLRDANNGPAGQIVQSSLEQSTVDIGTEFTKMIVVQRAFAAAAKIISTADEMLDELIRTKR